MRPTDPARPLAAELAAIAQLLREGGELLVAEAARRRPRGRSASKLDVDVEIEELLVAGLGRAFPGDGVLAEERTSRAGTSGRRWVIDPHDGTSDFAVGARETSISVALEADGELVLGAVYLPCVPLVRDARLRALLGDEPLLLTWARGEPLRRNGAPVERGPAPAALRPGAVALVSRKVPPEVLEVSRRLLGPAEVLPCGSIATRLALAACGAVEAGYTLRNPLAPWDYLGGQALLLGAGGALLDAGGRPVGPGHDGNAYVGARSEALARQILERLEREYPDLIALRAAASAAEHA